MYSYIIRGFRFIYIYMYIYVYIYINVYGYVLFICVGMVILLAGGCLRCEGSYYDGRPKERR